MMSQLLPTFEASTIQWVMTVLGGVTVVCMLRIVNQMSVITTKIEYMAKNLVDFGKRVDKHSDSVKDLDKKMAVVTREIETLKTALDQH